MKNKLELISKGFIVYKIKRYIDHIQKELREKTHKTELQQVDKDIKSSSPNVMADDSFRNSIRLQNGEYNQAFLDHYDLVIGMAGKPIKKHLAEIEKRIGKPVTTIGFME